MRRFILVFAILISQLVLSQSPSDTNKHQKHNVIGVFMGNTVIYQSNLHVPTIGVEYIRELSHAWGVGVIVEGEIGYHILENKDTPDEVSVYHRESALLVSPTIFFRPFGSLIISAGYGIEFEQKHNLGLLKVGVEYKLEMKNPNFYILPSLSWDHTELFDGVVYGIVFAYKL